MDGRLATNDYLIGAIASAKRVAPQSQQGDRGASGFFVVISGPHIIAFFGSLTKYQPQNMYH